MAIKVQIPDGKSTVTIGGLFQWDYGQELEIECAEIGTEILEVHFACHNMQEAKVRACSFTDGVGRVTIPDECLEQTGAITAWVYEIDSTRGHTIKTITLPITARTRPGKKRDVPPEYTDQYGQLIEEVNKAINRLEMGEITVAEADYTPMANHAVTAGEARSATYATSAGTANYVNFSSPVASAEVTNGLGETPALINNSAYLVILKTGLIYNGILLYTVEVNNTTQINRGLVTSLGNLTLTVNPESSLMIMTSENSIATNISGTLYFYKLGGITA